MEGERQSEDTREPKSPDFHVIYGSPYLLREEIERKGVFFQVKGTAAFDGSLHTNFDRNIPELVLERDIYEFFPDNLKLGFVFNSVNSYDFQIVRGLRHLARLEGAEYVSYQLHEGKYFGIFIPGQRVLVIPRFFNRTPHH